MKVILLETYSGGPWNQNWTKRVMKNSRALMDSEKVVGWMELVACVGFVGEASFASSWAHIYFFSSLKLCLSPFGI